MSHDIFPTRPPLPTAAQQHLGIEACLVVQRRARTMGKRPFAAVLVGADNETVLLTHQSVDHVNHAEASLARLAACHYTQEYLWTCTLYSTWVSTFIGLWHFEQYESRIKPPQFHEFFPQLGHLLNLSLTGLQEPCAMCTSTCYWANIGRIVYAASETELAELTGSGNEENMTMAMPCRMVIEGSQKAIEIIGPLKGLEDVVVRESDEFWRPIREKRAP